jgi:hypothetical protein
VTISSSTPVASINGSSRLRRRHNAQQSQIIKCQDTILRQHMTVLLIDREDHVAADRSSTPDPATCFRFSRRRRSTACVDATALERVQALIIPPDRLRALLIAEAELGERIMRALILRRVAILQTGERIARWISHKLAPKRRRTPTHLCASKNASRLSRLLGPDVEVAQQVYAVTFRQRLGAVGRSRAQSCFPRKAHAPRR